MEGAPPGDCSGSSKPVPTTSVSRHLAASKVRSAPFLHGWVPNLTALMISGRWIFGGHECQEAARGCASRFGCSESGDDDALPDPQQVQAMEAQQAHVVTLSRQGMRGNTFHEICTWFLRSMTPITIGS